MEPRSLDVTLNSCYVIIIKGILILQKFEMNSNFGLIFHSKSNFSRHIAFMNLLFLGFGGHLSFCGVSDDTVLDL